MSENAALYQEKWLLLKSGDSAAFKFLFDTFSNNLFNYGAKFTHDKDLVKECVQEVYVTIWNRRNFLGEPVSVRNYLFKAFRRLLFKQLATKQKRTSYSEISEQYTFQVELSAEEQLMAQERGAAIRARLEKALASLTARQREAVFLKFNDNLSYEEIAEVMDISVKATYKLMARALDVLRDNLSDENFMLLMALAFGMLCSSLVA